MIPYCLCTRKLWISSGPRIYLKRFCILGARIPGGYCGVLGTIDSFGRSGYSASDNYNTIYITTSKRNDC